MPSPFATRDAKVSGAIDRAFGEQFNIEPFVAQNDVDRRKIADTSRTAMLGVVGVWEGTAKSKTPTARGSASDDMAHNWGASFPSVSFDDNTLLWMPVMGDKVTRLFDGTVYSVAEPFSDAMGRILIQLTRRRGA